MSRQQRFIYLSLVGTTLLCLLAGVYLLAWKHFSKSGSSAKIVKHSVETPSEDALKYWTKDKMRHARAARMPTTNALSRGKKQQQHPPHASNPPNA